MARSPSTNSYLPAAVVPSSAEALFRYQVVSQVRALVAGGRKASRAMRAVAASVHVDFKGESRRVSLRSVQRWFASYQQSGIAGLEPASRNIAVDSKVLPAKLQEFVVLEKRRDPRASVPELIRRAREKGLIARTALVSRVTVFRYLLRQGIATTHVKRLAESDMRRFAYPHRLQMVLSDGKHFRIGVYRTKRVALFFLDDATREALHVVVGPSESTVLFLRGVYGLICRYGFPGALYLDKGPGFKSEATLQVLANLDIPFIFGKTRYPQGHGKIERFNRTAKADVLRQLDGRPEIDADCTSLELRLADYLEHAYNQRPHEELDHQTPWERFSSDPMPLRLPEDRPKFEEKFCLYERRRVSADHVVDVENVHYEVPRGLAGQRVELRLGFLDGSVSLVRPHERPLELAKVDLAFNARDRRSQCTAANEPEPMPVPGAAELAFNRRFAPVVDADGGFLEPTASKKKGTRKK